MPGGKACANLHIPAEGAACDGNSEFKHHGVGKGQGRAGWGLTGQGEGWGYIGPRMQTGLAVLYLMPFLLWQWFPNFYNWEFP